MLVAEKLGACVAMTAAFFWDSLYGLIFGFLLSALAQTVFSRGAMERALGPNLRGVVNGSLFGIVASACSYGAAAAARGFYAKGADLRAVLAFAIASTNMNIAILIMFWAMLGWRFAFAEFFGGIVIIAVVVAGATLLLRPSDLRAPASAAASRPARVSECLQCGMDGEDDHAVTHDGTVYLFCGSRHEHAFRADPAGVLAAAASDAERGLGFAALRERKTWTRVFETLVADVEMLRSELVLGFAIAGCAAALVPPAWIAAALRAIGRVPFVGSSLLLLAGLALAAVTFVCSMGNVPIARFLALAGIPLGANTTFIYGDLLIPPLVAVYRKSFPPRAVWVFLALFVCGALAAGALMDALVGRAGPPPAMGAMGASDRFTLAANVAASIALVAVTVAARGGRPRRQPVVASH